MAADGTPRKRANKKSITTDGIEKQELREPSVERPYDGENLKTHASNNSSKKDHNLSKSKSVSSSRTSEFSHNFWLVVVSLLAFVTRAAMIHHPGEVV